MESNTGGVAVMDDPALRRTPKGAYSTLLDQERATRVQELRASAHELSCKINSTTAPERIRLAQELAAIREQLKGPGSEPLVRSRRELERARGVLTQRQGAADSAAARICRVELETGYTLAVLEPGSPVLERLAQLRRDLGELEDKLFALRTAQVEHEKAQRAVAEAVEIEQSRARSAQSQEGAADSERRQLESRGAEIQARLDEIGDPFAPVARMLEEADRLAGRSPETKPKAEPARAVQLPKVERPRFGRPPPVYG